MSFSIQAEKVASERQCKIFEKSEEKRSYIEMNGTSSPTEVEVLVERWKITHLSSPSHFKPLSLCWRHLLHHSTPSFFAEGQRQHLLAQGLINWLIRRPRCKLIDWSSCSGSCLYLRLWGAKLRRSPVICHVQHMREDEEEMKRRGFITETWGACMKEVSARVGTRGMPREQWGHGDKGSAGAWRQRNIEKDKTIWFIITTRNHTGTGSHEVGFHWHWPWLHLANGLWTHVCSKKKYSCRNPHNNPVMQQILRAMGHRTMKQADENKC